MQQEEPKRQICFDFTKNQCSRGANCKFSHDLNLIIEVNSQEKGICFDFLKGTCSRGPLCRFSHDLRNLEAAKSNSNPLGPFENVIPPPNDLVSALNRPKTSPICYDFVKNQCSRGPECKYSHDYSSILMGPRQPAGKNPHIMCMDFVRGRCSRGASCKYAHFDPMQLAAAAAAAAGGSGNGGSYGAVGGVTMAAAAAQEQAAMSNARMNSTNYGLAGLPPQQAHALLAAARAAAARSSRDLDNDSQQQQQQQYFGGHDGLTPGIDTAWATTTQTQQQYLESEYSASLMQMQQLALHNDAGVGEGGAHLNYNSIDNMTSTAEDVLPIPLKLPLPAGQQVSSLPRYPQNQQQQQSTNDVSTLSMLLMQQRHQRQQQQQQRDHLIRAHRQQQQQQHHHQRRPSNLGPSTLPASFPMSDTGNYVESNNSNAPTQEAAVKAAAAEAAMPLSTTHHQTQRQQHQNWAVNFQHPLLQKVQSADLRHSGTLNNNRPGGDMYPTTSSDMGNPAIRDTSTIMDSTNLSSNGGGGGGSTGGGGVGGRNGASETNSPTIRAAWGAATTVNPQKNTNNSTNNKNHASLVSSRPTSQPSSLGAGSPLNDGLATGQYMQQQEQQQQQPGLDALKSIWSKP